MKTIIFFIPNLGKGGAEKILVNLANKISCDYNEKFRVMIALSQKEGYYLDYVNPSVDIVDLKASHVSQSVFRLAKLIRSTNKEGVHLFSFLGYANIFAIMAAYLSCCRKKIDLIVSERNHIPWDKDIRSRLVYLFQKVLYKKCDAVVTISDSISKEIEEKLHVPSNRIHTIYNPLIIGNTAPIPENYFRKSEWNIITAGRLIPVKDFPLLFKAFKIVNNERPSRLWILGEGPEKDNLVGLSKELNIEDKVVMCGFVNNPFSYFQKADVYVCSSLSEGFANVILEAMAAGTRIVSMSCGGPDEILEYGKWGTIIKERMPHILANAIIDAVSNKKIDCTKRLEQFDINIIVSQYVNVLH